MSPSGRGAAEGDPSDCVRNAERFILRAAAAANAGVEDEEIRKRLLGEGCYPDQVELLLVAGRQLAAQRERDWEGVAEKGEKVSSFQEASSRGSLWTVDYFASAPGEQRGVWRVAVVQAMSKDEAVAKVRNKESTNVYNVLTRISVLPGDNVPGYEPEYILREHVAKDECHVCQPFTKLVRDVGKLKACMAVAAPLGDLKDSRNLYELLKSDLQRQDQEVFVVVTLDFRGQLRDYAEVARGQRHRVATDIEDITRIVIQSVNTAGADGFVVAHCHPTGVAEPSDADGDLTKAIKDAAAISLPTVHVLDHIVVGLGEYYSFADNDWSVDGKVTKVR